MDLQEIKATKIWGLYEIGQNYHRRVGIYTDTDRNYRFYNGDQWEGAKLGDVEPVQKNFIRPIVKYKLAIIHSNLYAINFASENFENKAFRKQAEKYCEMLNRFARRNWERDKMDSKVRKITKDAAINDEGIMYVWFDAESNYPVCEVVKKNDIYYGNENDGDIQSQPYILMRKRLPVVNAQELALREGLSEDKLQFIIGDNDTFEQSGDASKIEVDNMVTIVYKFYKKNGTVHYSIASRWVDIAEDNDIGLTFYPLAHMVWEDKEGSARGEGEVRNLIPNQIEVNKTEMRRVLTVKSQAYPQKIADVSKISNPQAVNTVGGIIETRGSTVDDVHKIVGVIPPATMSPDVKQLQEDLIQMSRDLAGAGETATGQVDPENASGRAILAVQQASQAPVTEQKDSFKAFVEDIARIQLEYLIVFSPDGVNLEEEIDDPMTGEKIVQIVKVPQIALQELKASVKIDITPKSAFDRFAQEQTVENLLINGLFNPQRVGELKAYAESLDDDSVAPKLKILEIVDNILEEQKKIALIDAQAQIMQQRANQFLLSDPDSQAAQIADVMNSGYIEDEEEIEGEEEIEEIEEGMDEPNPDDN